MPTNLFAEFPTTKIKPQPLWQTLSNLHPSHGNPYNPTQLFCGKWKITPSRCKNESVAALSWQPKLLKKDPLVFRKSVPTQSNWETLFSKATTKAKTLTIANSKFTTKLLMDLSTTNPFLLFQSFRLENGNLHPTLMTSIWFSAQTLCGSNYETDLKPPPAKTMKVLTITSYLSALKSVSEETKKPANPMTTPHNPYKPTPNPTTPKASNQKTIQLSARKHTRERYDSYEDIR